MKEEDSYAVKLLLQENDRYAGQYLVSGVRQICWPVYFAGVRQICWQVYFAGVRQSCCKIYFLGERHKYWPVYFARIRQICWPASLAGVCQICLPVYSGQYPVIHAGRWRLVLKAGSANSQQAASLVLSKVENTHISYKEGYLIGIQIYLFLQLGLLVAFEPPPGDKTIEIITKYI